MDIFLEQVEGKELGRIIYDADLSKYTTYKVGGKARAIIYPKDRRCLVELCKLIKTYHIKYKILGNGSNLLFSDELYDGVLIKLDEFDKDRVCS